jgi:hypothetical protein
LLPRLLRIISKAGGIEILKLEDNKTTIYKLGGI